MLASETQHLFFKELTANPTRMDGVLVGLYRGNDGQLRLQGCVKEARLGRVSHPAVCWPHAAWSVGPFLGTKALVGGWDKLVKRQVTKLR